MPKAILEFNLPEENDEFTLAKDGFSWYEVCMELESYLREEIKYHADNYDKKQIDVLENIRSKLHELISDEVGIADIYSYVK
jgi:hypothetical protein